MIVMKLGGTSVQDSLCMDQSLDIVLKQADQGVLLVSSAMSKMTDSLLALGNCAKKGNKDLVVNKVNEIKARHLEAAQNFLTNENKNLAINSILKLIQELKEIALGLCGLKACSIKSLDSLLAFGELLSTTLLFFRIKERGFKSEWIDSRTLIKTDNQYGLAVVNFDETNPLIQKEVKAKAGTIIVAQGFIASTSSKTLKPGITTTLGRGGSDYSAAIYASALEAKEIQIWTDVNGIMTTDPKIVRDAKTITQISYDEASELAFFGAKVVHPETIRPAIKKNIPVLVLNTKNIDGLFTCISQNSGVKGLKAIAGKRGITLININSSRMLNAHGFLNQIFQVFEEYKTSVDLISTSEISVSLTIDSTRYLDEIIHKLSKIATINVEQNKSIVCMVGQSLWKETEFLSKAFGALKQIPIRMISLGSSDTNLSCVVPEELLNDAIISLHSEFFN